MTPDSALLRKWKTERDPAAFAELVRRHAGMVYRAAYRVLCNPEQSEEVTQECFIKLAECPAISHSAGGWLHAVSVNHAIDRLRSEHARQDRETRYVAQTQPSETLEWTEIQALVEEAVASLPEGLRDAITCRYLEGCTLEETALHLGVARSTVQARLDKAVQTIRSFLKRRGIPVPLPALIAALKSGSAEATPATLTLALGKLALAGTAGKASSALTAGMATAGGIIMAKKIVLITVLVAVVFAGWLIQQPPSQFTSTTEVEPSTPVANEFVEQPEAAAPAPPSSDPVKKENSFFSAISDLLTTQKSCTVSGKVVDPGGRPIENVRVTAEGLGVREEDTTDAAGLFELTGLDAGRNRINARKWPATTATVAGDDGQPIEMRPMPFMGSNDTEAVLKLEPGEHRKGVRIVYDRAWTISGHVTDVNGAPVGNAQIMAGNSESGGSLTRSRDDGTFVVDDLVEGEYQLDVMDGRYQVAQLSHVPAGTTDLDIVLEPPFVVEGRVLDEATGAPVKHFEVALGRNASETGGLSGSLLEPFQTMDDPRGLFTLTARQPGSLVVAARVPGYAIEWQPLTLDSDHPAAYVDLLLAKGGDLRGFVRDVEGRPIKGAHVFYGSFHLDLVQIGSTVVTDLNGAFTLPAFPRRAQRITAYDPAYAYGDMVVPVTHDTDVPVEIVLTKGGTIKGTVTIEDPLEASTIIVSVAQESGHVSRDRGRTELPAAGGAFVLNQMQPGAASLQVQIRGAEPYFQTRLIEKPVSIRDGATSEVAVELSTGRGAIEGTVPMTTSGVPSRPLVQLAWTGTAGQETYRVTPADDGTFRIEGISEGSGELQLRANLAGTENDAPMASEAVTLADGESLTYDFPDDSTEAEL